MYFVFQENLAKNMFLFNFLKLFCFGLKLGLSYTSLTRVFRNKRLKKNK